MQIIQSLLKKTVSLPGHLFVIWRTLFGIYFVYYAIRMIPYAEEIYGRTGLVSDAHLNWTYGIFPGLFSFSDTTTTIVSSFCMIVLAGFCIAGGLFPRIAPIVIWYLQTSLYNRNNLTDDPSQAFVGLLLLTLALIPHQPKLLTKKYEDVNVPFFVFFGPVFVFCTAFTVSGIDKILSTSWLNGTAFWYMLHLGIARHHFMDLWLIGHQSFTHALSYIAVLTQFLCLPLFLCGKYRWSLAINFLSFSIMFTLFDLNQVILGMLFFYSFFLLSTDWKISWQVFGRLFPIHRYTFLPIFFGKGRVKR